MKKLSHMYMKKNTSFTLIELLVVIVIIGVLAGVIMVTTTSSVSNATLARAKAFSSNVQNSMLLNLVSEWTFDEGNANDSWGVNDGGSTTADYKSEDLGSCVFGGCYFFSGDDYVGVGKDASINNLPLSDFTINVWVKNSQYTEWGTIFGSYVNGIGWNLRTLYNTAHFDVTYPGGTQAIYRTTATVNNTWINITSVWKATTKTGRIYLNGVEADYQTTTPGSGTYTSDAGINKEIGRIPHGGGMQYFIGFIDDLRIYNAVLSSSQIKQNYIAGLNSMLANENISKEEYTQRIGALGQK